MTRVPPPVEGNPQQQRTKRDKALIAAIVALFSGGAVGYGLLIGMQSALRVWGLEPEAARFLAEMASTETKVPDLGLPVGPMQKAAERQGWMWRAVYVLGAADRLQEAKDLTHAESVEIGYFARHVAAEHRRIRSAALVDVTSRLLEDRTEEQSEKAPLLGWRAHIDEKTTPECKWANGRNFRADRPTVIGIPGSVHPRCRCTSGPPVKGAPLIPSA